MNTLVNTKTAAKDRDLDLDFVKGFLVVVMVIYHAMNHVATVPAEYFGYLRFVNGSFVFLCGYGVAVFYAGAFYVGENRHDKRSAFRRLASRGVKLLCVFTALNLAISAAGMTNYRNVTFAISDYLYNAASIYGSGDADNIAFRILVPISYLLILSGLYLLSRRSTATLIALTIAATLVFMFLEPEAPNVFFLLTGLVGLCVGLSMGRIKSDVFQHRVDNWPAICIGFIALASVMNALSGNVLAYGLGIALLLKLVYDGASLLARNSRPYAAVVLLGKYSLVCYIAQIGFLFLLFRALRDRALASEFELPLAFLATCAFLLGACMLIEKLRNHSRLAEKTYRVVFA